MCTSINKTNSFQQFHYLFVSMLYSKRNWSEIKHYERKLRSACVEISRSTGTPINGSYPILYLEKNASGP